MRISTTGESEEIYSRISIEEGSDVDKEAPFAAKKLLQAKSLRERYAAMNPRQLLWAYDGKNAFEVDTVPSASNVRKNNQGNQLRVGTENKVAPTAA